MSVQPVPEHFHAITPRLVCRNAGEAIEFYKKAFGAEERCRMPGPAGRLMHAEVMIGDSIVMICDEFPDMGIKSPLALEGSPVTLHIYVNDVDAAFKRAVDAGCTVTMGVQDMFWGDRYGKLSDPYGHNWSLATHKEDLTEEQIAERAALAFGGGPE